MASPLEELFRAPLMSVIASRRTHRLPQGVSVDAGQLSHTSESKPLPLSALEEAILIVVSNGITGAVAHDGPIDRPNGGKELATPFMNVLARSAPSPDNSQPTHFAMINDDCWMLRKPLPQEWAGLLKEVPPQFHQWSESDWIAMAGTLKHRIRPGRLEMPREFPYYIGWNKQMSNKPGTTIFVPLVDTTRMMINGILNLLAEPPGQRPLFVDDFRPFTPHNARDSAGWLAEHAGIIDKIPYQPIGGLRRATGKFVNREIPMPLGLIRTFLSDHESFYLTHNLMLVAEAMGLGSWVHACAPSPYLLLGDERTDGLGFREQRPTKEWGEHWPPLPATQPHPIGLDGVFETLTPPYVGSMDEAVERVLEQKFGEHGAYGNEAGFGKAYRRQEDAKWYLQNGDRYPPEGVVYAKEICNYIWHEYSRFPAHVDAVYHAGTWLQIAHLEMPYYERYFHPWHYQRQAGHAAVWPHG